MRRRPEGALTGAELLPADRSDAPELAWAGKAAEELAQIGAQDPQVADAAIEVLLEALHHEAEMTSQLLASVGSGPGALVGLEHRLKSPSSLARKIGDTAVKMMSTPKEAAERLNDTIRYTITTTKQTDLIPTLIRTTETLLASGWAVCEAEESFVAGNPYKGIHLVVSGPTGHRCEIQFHTQAAFNIKQRGHVDYEKYRDVDLPLHIRLRAFNKSVDRWNAVSTPRGLRRLRMLGGIQIVSKTYLPPDRPKEDQK